MFLNPLMKVIFGLNFLLTIIFILNIKCQEFSTDNNSSKFSDFSGNTPKDSSLDNQTPFEELITNETQSSDFYTNITKSSETEEVSSISTTNNINNTSEPPKTTTSEIGIEVYIWIFVAVVYIILVIIGLVWTLKEFCDIKLSETFEEKRIVGVLGILEKREVKTVPDQTPEGVLPTGVTLVIPSNGVNESSVRTVNVDTPPEQPIDSKKTKLLNPENGMTSAQTTQPKLDNKLPINKINTNTNSQVSIPGNTTDANTAKKS